MRFTGALCFTLSYDVPICPLPSPSYLSLSSPEVILFTGVVIVMVVNGFML